MLVVRLLGPLEVDADGASIAVTAPMQQALLAALALAHGHALTRDQIVDALWEQPPAQAANTIQQYVSALRSRIGRDYLATTSSGYRLDLAGGVVDTARLAELTSQARGRRRAGDLGGCRRACAAAVALPRGEPLSGLPDLPFVSEARAAVTRAVVEARLLAARTDIDLGDAPAALPVLAELAADHPLDEAVAVERLRAMAASGRQAEALEMYERTRVRLVDELGVDPGPELQAAYLALLEQDAAFAAPAATRGMLAPVPVPVNALLGRGREVDDLERMLKAPSTRVVTVTGPGGAGKTRLAIDVARRALREREVAYVALAPIRDPDLVLPTVALALGLRHTPEVDPVAEVARAASGRDLLLVLDSLEQVLPAAAELARLVALAEGVQLLVTSREALRISPEQRYPLGPLATEGNGAASSASELFSERARAVDPGYRPAEHDAAVDEICRKLDGLPLAIELAAARTNVLSPADLVRHLDRRLALLDRGPRDAPDRHGSLRACLAWSVDLLGEEERAVLAAASVFVGGMTLPALEAVCLASGAATNVLSAVDSLEAKSLLRLRRDPDGGRLHLMEMVREYAAELLDAAGRTEETMSCHAAFFHQSVAENATVLPWPPRTAQQVRRLLGDLPNLRAALDHLAATGDSRRGADLVVAAWAAWSQMGTTAEPSIRAQHLLGATELSPTRRVHLLIILCLCRSYEARPAEAISFSEEALRILQVAPDPAGEAMLRAGRAIVLDRPGAEDVVRREGEASLAAARRSQDPELEAMVAGLLTGLWAARPGSTAALEVGERSLAVAREHGNEILELILLMDISEAVLAEGDAAALARCVTYGQEGYRLGLELEQPRVASGCLNNGATAALLTGQDPVPATDELRAALEMAWRMSDASHQIELLLRLAAGWAAQGDLVRATALESAWRHLSPMHGINTTRSNQRIHDTFLAGVADAGRSRTWTLAEAVGVALGQG